MVRQQTIPSMTLDIHADPNSVQAAFLLRAMSAVERIAADEDLDRQAAEMPAGTLGFAKQRAFDIGSLTNARSDDGQGSCRTAAQRSKAAPFPPRLQIAELPRAVTRIRFDMLPPIMYSGD